jgi:hypothetical protein
MVIMLISKKKKLARFIYFYFVVDDVHKIFKMFFLDDFLSSLLPLLSLFLFLYLFVYFYIA